MYRQIHTETLSWFSWFDLLFWPLVPSLRNVLDIVNPKHKRLTADSKDDATTDSKPEMNVLFMIKGVIFFEKTF